MDDHEGRVLCEPFLRELHAALATSDGEDEHCKDVMETLEVVRSHAFLTTLLPLCYHFASRGQSLLHCTATRILPETALNPWFADTHRG